MRLQSMEERLRMIEDRLEIYQILSAFAPVIDGGGEASAAEFFTETGEYEVDVPGVPTARGRSAVQKLFEAPIHREAIKEGIAHTIGFPHVSISGEHARAITYACIFRRKEEKWYVSRIASTEFTLVRLEDGWRITRRASLDLNSDGARAIFSARQMDLPWNKTFSQREPQR